MVNIFALFRDLYADCWGEPNHPAGQSRHHARHPGNRWALRIRWPARADAWSFTLPIDRRLTDNRQVAAPSPLADLQPLAQSRPIETVQCIQQMHTQRAGAC